MAILSCSRPRDETTLNPLQLAASYRARIGIAVRTETRLCVAIKNGNLAVSSPMTLVIPTTPQSFGPVRIKAPSEETCPITKDGDNALTSYELNLPDWVDRVPKLQPMVAVVGDPGSFLLTNITVQADLDQTREARMFHICGDTDGYRLTVWSATPLTSDLLWSGFYYDPGRSRSKVAACAPAEKRQL